MVFLASSGGSVCGYPRSARFFLNGPLVDEHGRFKSSALVFSVEAFQGLGVNVLGLAYWTLDAHFRVRGVLSDA